MVTISNIFEISKENWIFIMFYLHNKSIYKRERDKHADDVGF